MIRDATLPAFRDDRGHYRVTRDALVRHIARYGPLAAALRLDGPRPMTVAEAARLIGAGASTVREWCQAGILPTRQPPKSAGYKIDPADLLEFLRRRGDRAAVQAAARGLRPPHATLLVASRDRLVRLATAPWAPAVATSMFGLGWAAARTPHWGAVIDFELAGRDAAYDAAERLSAEGSPALIGLAAEDHVTARRPGIWDVILTRPVTAGNLSACVRELHATA
jgi:excisionase family DNA binding protein